MSIPENRRLPEPGTAYLSGLIVTAQGVGVAVLSTSVQAALLAAVTIGVAIAVVLLAQP